MTLFKLILPAILVAAMWGYLPVMEKKILEHVETNNYLDKHNPLSRISAIIYYVKEKYNLLVK